MKYEIEELIPLVGWLAQKYTSGESTSVTYEKAEQLMEAVLYCIREAERETEYAVAAPERMTAEKIYHIGAEAVERKTKTALKLYHQILPEFHSYENQCLQDTMTKGIPEFFKWYDVRFAPQETILTLEKLRLNCCCLLSLEQDFGAFFSVRMYLVPARSIMLW